MLDLFRQRTEAVGHLPPQQLVLDDLAGEQLLELVPRPMEDVELHLVLLAGGGQLLVERPLQGP